MYVGPWTVACLEEESSPFLLPSKRLLYSRMILSVMHCAVGQCNWWLNVVLKSYRIWRPRVSTDVVKLVIYLLVSNISVLFSIDVIEFYLNFYYISSFLSFFFVNLAVYGFRYFFGTVQFLHLTRLFLLAVCTGTWQLQIPYYYLDYCIINHSCLVAIGFARDKLYNL